MVIRPLATALLLACVFQIDPAPGPAPAGGQDQPDLVRIEIPLREGRLEIRDLIERTFRAADLTPPPWLDELDWSIDAASTTSWLKIEALRQASGGAFDVELHQDRLAVSIDQERLASLGSLIEQQVYKWASDLAGRREPVVEPVYGVTFVTDGAERARPGVLPAVPPRAVLLVHGLDDGGWRFNDLIPALRAAGHTVARFEYPNDGPIADAADRLAVELAALRAAGLTELDVVAHSMGALVVRDVLTREVYYGGDGAGGDRYPAVVRLIMAAPPNHGSHAARLHALAEMVEHAHHGAPGGPGGRTSWLEWSADGQGEAGIDLLPGSVFLSRLNARPLPGHTRITIIAGRISPISGADVERLSRLARRIAGAEGGERVPAILGGAVVGLGDGLVTIDSAKLDGVEDFVVVRADHQSMIVNASSSDRVPPAIPIILDRLSEP